MNIDGRLQKGDPTLVDDIAKVTTSGKNKYFYSFASKYYSHHNPTAYPIYDSYVEKVLKHFRKTNPNFNFNNDYLKQYDKFKNILIDFKTIWNRRIQSKRFR